MLFSGQKIQWYFDYQHHPPTLYNSLLSSHVVVAGIRTRFWHLLFYFLYKSSLNRSNSYMEQNQSLSSRSVLIRMISRMSVTAPSANQTFQYSFLRSPFPSNSEVPIRRWVILYSQINNAPDVLCRQCQCPPDEPNPRGGKGSKESQGYLVCYSQPVKLWLRRHRQCSLLSFPSK